MVQADLHRNIVAKSQVRFRFFISQLLWLVLANEGLPCYLRLYRRFGPAGSVMLALSPPTVTIQTSRRPFSVFGVVLVSCEGVISVLSSKKKSWPVVFSRLCFSGQRSLCCCHFACISLLRMRLMGIGRFGPVVCFWWHWGRFEGRIWRDRRDYRS